MELGFIVLIVLVVIASLCSNKKSRANRCPKCGKDSLETVSRFWGGSSRRCKHTIRCGWNGRDESNKAKRQAYEAKEAAIKARADDQFIASLYEQEKRNRNR